MSLTKLTEALNIIGQLGTTPQERAITTQEFKDKFDEASGLIKTYVNNTLTTEIESAKIVSVTESKTIGETDAFTMQSCSHATTQINITVPPNSSVAFPTGTQIVISRDGAADVAIVAGSGVTIVNTKLKISNQYDTAVLIKKDTNTWQFVGSTKA